MYIVNVAFWLLVHFLYRSYLTSCSITPKEMENGFGKEKHGYNFPLSRVVNNGDKNKFSITLKQREEEKQIKCSLVFHYLIFTLLYYRVSK